ncbi:MAG: hypothetical protein L0Z54_00680 [Thermoplasmata archaeon]|nr:hypothetical protein [Thermoplasmata archaeon]
MIDSKKLLNFNPDREYLFRWPRGVDFDLSRRLLFDPERELFFDADRELDIRMRGVIFRGNVCPGCGGLVLQDALRCDGCGHVFEKRAEAMRTHARRIERKWGSRDRGANGDSPTGSGPSGEGPVAGTFRCHICGTLLYAGTARCPICGISSASHGGDGSSGERRSVDAREGADKEVEVAESACEEADGGAADAGGAAGVKGPGGGTDEWRRDLPREDWKL